MLSDMSGCGVLSASPEVHTATRSGVIRTVEEALDKFDEDTRLCLVFRRWFERVEMTPEARPWR